jgi:hydrogenase maturation protease
MKTIVVGLGNPILGDDGVGWHVAKEVGHLMDPELQVNVECLALGGITLMEHLIGYQRAILIDACFSDEEPGSVIVLHLNDIPDLSAFHTASAHDMSLQNAIKLGRNLGAQLPEEVIIVGISARWVHDFSDELSSLVAEAVPKAAHIVMELVRQKITIH